MRADRYYEKRRLGSHPAVCDVCGKSVGLGSYIYLCLTCRDKLPKAMQEGHHALINYPKIRQAILKHGIKLNLLEALQ